MSQWPGACDYFNVVFSSEFNLVIELPIWDTCNYSDHTKLEIHSLDKERPAKIEDIQQQKKIHETSVKEPHRQMRAFKDNNEAPWVS